MRLTLPTLQTLHRSLDPPCFSFLSPTLRCLLPAPLLLLPHHRHACSLNHLAHVQVLVGYLPSRQYCMFPPQLLDARSDLRTSRAQSRKGTIDIDIDIRGGGRAARRRVRDAPRTCRHKGTVTGPNPPFLLLIRIPESHCSDICRAEEKRNARPCSAANTVKEEQETPSKGGKNTRRDEQNASPR